MQIPRSADYGVRVMTRLAMQSGGRRLTVAELARDSGVSIPFVGKILQRLVAAQLVVSRRGRDGGFALARSAGTISMLDIVSVLDQPLCINACLPGGAGCSRQAGCGAHLAWVKAQAALARVLAVESLDHLAAFATSSQGVTADVA